MSQYHNNNLLHNIRIGVRMINEGMPADVAAYAMTRAGIATTPSLLAAAAEPGVLQAMESKPFTHARADQHIAGYQALTRFLAEHEIDVENSTDQIRPEVVYNDDPDDDEGNTDIADRPGA